LLTSALGRGEWSVSRAGRLTPGRDRPLDGTVVVVVVVVVESQDNI
jgi:hypothetical protein